jgi:uncharacterized membrane protein YhaH (DUF805 family)
MQGKLIVAGLIVIAIVVVIFFVAGSIGNSSSGSGTSEVESPQEETAEAVAPDIVTGVDAALYSMSTWLVVIPIVIMLTAIAVLIRWLRPPHDE